MNRKYFIAGLALALFTSSCGTILHGSRQDIAISSNPSSATVVVNNQNVGQTPITVNLSRKESHDVKIELEGYMPFETTIIRKVDGWIAGNIIFGGIIGLAVDAITGGMYKLTPEQVQAELRNSNVSARYVKDGAYIVVVLKAKTHWEKVGQMEQEF